jgi:hypothetical protein
MQFSFGQADGVGLAFAQMPHSALAYGSAAGVGDAHGGAPFPTNQVMSLYGRRSGMSLEGSAS